VSWLKAITNASVPEHSSPFDLRLDKGVLAYVYDNVSVRQTAPMRDHALRVATQSHLQQLVRGVHTMEDLTDLDAAIVHNSAMKPLVKKNVRQALANVHSTFTALAGLQVDGDIPNVVADSAAEKFAINKSSDIYENAHHFEMLRIDTIGALRYQSAWPGHLVPIGPAALRIADNCRDFKQFRQQIAKLDCNAAMLDPLNDRTSRYERQQIRAVRGGVNYAFQCLRQATGFSVQSADAKLISQVAANAWRKTHISGKPFHRLALPAPGRNS